MSALQRHIAALSSPAARSESEQSQIDEMKEMIRPDVPDPTDADALLWMIACGAGAFPGDEWMLRELHRMTAPRSNEQSGEVTLRPE